MRLRIKYEAAVLLGFRYYSFLPKGNTAIKVHCLVIYLIPFLPIILSLKQYVYPSTIEKPER
jgi:hypothetical protein